MKKAREERIDDQLPKEKGKFPSLPERLQIQSERETNLDPQANNPLFITSLKYSLKSEATKWQITGNITLYNPMLGQVVSTHVKNIALPETTTLKFNSWKIRDKTPNCYEISNPEINGHLQVPFSSLTAFPPEIQENIPEEPNKLPSVDIQILQKKFEELNINNDALQKRLKLSENKAIAFEGREESLRRELLVHRKLTQALTFKLNEYHQANQLFNQQLCKFKKKHTLVAKRKNKKQK